MIDFFGTTQQTAVWLLENDSARNELLRSLADEPQLEALLTRAAFSAGPVRMAYDVDVHLVTFWNADYLTGVGDEGLGFIRLSEPFGLLTRPQIQREVFERALTVLNYRLRNLIFDSTFYHQDFGDGSHKVLAGRGSEARNYSLGYFETQLKLRDQETYRKSLICVGPEHDWETVAKAARDSSDRIPQLAQILADHTAGRRLPTTVLPSTALKPLRDIIAPNADERADLVTQRTNALVVDDGAFYRAASLTYDEWVDDRSTLSDDQRTILLADGILSHPIRIIGPAGSGKTLLMQLMAMRRLRSGSVSVMYATHNEPMATAVKERFHVLGAEEYLLRGQLAVTTLERFAREIIPALKNLNLLENRAAESKRTQLDLVKDAFQEVAAIHAVEIQKSKILRALLENLEQFSDYIRADISVAIKARNLRFDAPGYTGSPVALGKLHGILNPDEREIIFEVFRKYQKTLDEYSCFDTDDVALSVLSSVTSPVWEHTRKSLGFDFVFVDEAQLFNENEQKVFSHLTKGGTPHVPIAIALDQAQQFYGETQTGLGLIGIRDAERESLKVNHRMAKPIADLAFFTIAHSTELFSIDFPDFTEDTISRGSKDDEATPRLINVAENALLSNVVAQQVRELRKGAIKYKQIAIVCFVDDYWSDLVARLSEKLKDLDFSVMLNRGERPQGHAFTTLCKPSVIGGQEFDAVIAVGLEEGRCPKYVGPGILQTTLEQQAYRDMYLTFSRAKTRLIMVNSQGSRPTSILQAAAQDGLIKL